MSDAAETPPTEPAADASAALPHFTCHSCGRPSYTEAEHVSHVCESPPRPGFPCCADGPPPPASPTSRLDATEFLYDWDRMAVFVERCRLAGLKTFEHPTGLRFAFEQTPKMPIRPAEGW